MQSKFLYIILFNICLVGTGCQLNQVQETKQIQPVKNVILMIGDGMGPQQVAQAVQYRQLTHKKDKQLNFEQFLKDRYNGSVETFSANSLVTDSAAAATAMACGFKTNNGMLGLDRHGNKCDSILKFAKSLNKSTGLVSNTRLSHATPAAFASNNIDRKNENDIALQILDEGSVDVLLDGGGSYLIPQFKDDGNTPMKFSDLTECHGIDSLIDGKSKREDQNNLIEHAKKSGYNFVCTKDQLETLNLNSTNKVLGIFTNSVFPHIQERSRISTIPTLPEMTETALNLLSKNQNGFFLMIEGGLIDYAGHENDSATQLKETLEFDEAIGVVRQFITEHPDTLLLVTADHETGGFGFSFRQATEDEEPAKLIANNLEYKSKYKNTSSKDVFEVLHKQNSSFTGILIPILDKLYANDDAIEPKSSAYTLDMAAQDLIEQLHQQTPYTINEYEAKYVLTRHNGDQEHFRFEEHPFCTKEIEGCHADKLGKVVSWQNYSVWATGNHTAIPVQIFSAGPAQYSDMLRGHIDNTEIYEIMKTAMLNKTN